MKHARNSVGELFDSFAGFPLYGLALFIVMFLAYDSQVWRLGFYYDDWEGVFLYKLSFSAEQIWNYFLIDRPFSSLVHFIFNPIIGSSVVGWHLLGLGLNWLALVFFVKVMTKIWPEHVFIIGWIGLLIGLYPGITRQFVIRTSIPHFTSMLLFMISLWLMVLSLNPKNRKWIYLLPSIILGVVQIMIIEYFSGLELVRLILLFILVSRTETNLLNKIKKTICEWVPYISIFLIFLVFRLFILPRLQVDGETTKHSLKIIEGMTNNFFPTILLLMNNIAQDITHAIFYAWTLAIKPGDIELNSKTYLFSWALGLSVGLLSFWTMNKWNDKTSLRILSKTQIISSLIIAFIAIILGGLPIWIIGRQAIGGMWSSRFLLGPVFGSVSFLVILIVAITGSNVRKLGVIFAILVISAFSLQFRVGNDYVKDWVAQRSFFWQLKERIPGLAEHAFLVSPSETTYLTVDYQMAFAVNILYSTNVAEEVMQHWWINGPENLRSTIELETNAKRPVIFSFRNIRFNSDMEKAVPMLYNPSRGCLLIADPIYKNAPMLSNAEKMVFLTSHPEMILEKEFKPIPQDVFGTKPDQSWCFFFERADLARQYSKWDTVDMLWIEAQKLTFSPKYGPEYIPFIESAYQLNKIDQAIELSLKAAELTTGMQPMLCENWQRLISIKEPRNDEEKIQNLMNDFLNCDSLDLEVSSTH